MWVDTGNFRWMVFRLPGGYVEPFARDEAVDQWEPVPNATDVTINLSLQVQTVGHSAVLTASREDIDQWESGDCFRIYAGYGEMVHCFYGILDRRLSDTQVQLRDELAVLDHTTITFAFNKGLSYKDIISHITYHGFYDPTVFMSDPKILTRQSGVTGEQFRYAARMYDQWVVGNQPLQYLNLEKNGKHLDSLLTSGLAQIRAGVGSWGRITEAHRRIWDLHKEMPERPRNGVVKEGKMSDEWKQFKKDLDEAGDALIAAGKMEEEELGFLAGGEAAVVLGDAGKFQYRITQSKPGDRNPTARNLYIHNDPDLPELEKDRLVMHRSTCSDAMRAVFQRWNLPYTVTTDYYGNIFIGDRRAPHPTRFYGVLDARLLRSAPQVKNYFESGYWRNPQAGATGEVVAAVKYQIDTKQQKKRKPPKNEKAAARRRARDEARAEKAVERQGAKRARAILKATAPVETQMQEFTCMAMPGLWTNDTVVTHTGAVRPRAERVLSHQLVLRRGEQFSRVQTAPFYHTGALDAE